jgi:hypothetical protein
MTQQVINIGATANDGAGDPLRTAYNKCNNNFSELYSRLQTTPPATSEGVLGDLAGMTSYDDQYFYYCFADYVDDSTTIWKRILGSTF